MAQDLLLCFLAHSLLPRLHLESRQLWPYSHHPPPSTHSSARQCEDAGQVPQFFVSVIRSPAAPPRLRWKHCPAPALKSLWLKLKLQLPHLYAYVSSLGMFSSQKAKEPKTGSSWAPKNLNVAASYIRFSCPQWSVHARSEERRVGKE